MSRIGKKPIIIPSGVEVTVSDAEVKVKGSKGELKEKIHPLVKVVKKDKEVLVMVNDPRDKQQKALWGTFRNLINNMVEGVTKGFEKKLEINGVGYRAQVSGKKLTLIVGYSHPVDFELPQGIEAKVEKNIVILSGVDKQLVGETAAQVRRIRKPEPYKGAGIKYVDEVIRRKAGKAAKAVGGA